MPLGTQCPAMLNLGWPGTPINQWRVAGVTPCPFWAGQGCKKGFAPSAFACFGSPNKHLKSLATLCASAVWRDHQREKRLEITGGRGWGGAEAQLPCAPPPPHPRWPSSRCMREAMLAGSAPSLSDSSSGRYPGGGPQK